MKGGFRNGQVQPILLFCAVILFQLNCTEPGAYYWNGLTQGYSTYGGFK